MASPETEDLRRQFEAVSTEAAQLVEVLSEEQFHWRPQPGAWSIEECLAHLISTGRAEMPGIDAAIRQGRERGITGAGPFRYGPLERWALRFTEPPVKRKAPAPRSLQPAAGRPLAEVVSEFQHVQRQFLEQVENAGGLDLARVKVAIPFTRLVRFRLGFVLLQAAAHERRHLWQARQVAQALRLRG